MAVNGRIQKDGQSGELELRLPEAFAGANAGGRAGKPTPFR